MYPEKPEKKAESVFTRRVKAGSKRTYFFDVRPNRKGDYFIAITESRRVLNDEGGYEKNKIFLYKEDFNKFVKALEQSVGYVKTELMPDFDFTLFDREREEYDTTDTSVYTERETNIATDKKNFTSDNVFDENDKL